MSRTNLHIYPSTFTHESRILKETETLAQNGLFDRIDIIATGDGDLPEHEQLDEHRRVWRVPLKTFHRRRGLPGKAVRQTEWMLRTLCNRVGHGIACVNCHSVWMLPLGGVFKLLWRARLVYDTHELETESVAMSGARKWLAKVVERILIPFCDSVIVVSDSIAEWYKATYGLKNVHTVRNKPKRSPQADEQRSNLLRKAFDLQPEDRLFLYQGLLEKGRGIEILLDAFQHTAPVNHVVFMGYGSLQPVIRQHAQDCANIHLHPAVSTHELARYTSDADVGLCVIEDCCLSYRYCLPNKLFEYLACGLPVIVSKLPDLVRVIDQYECGWVVDADTASVLEVVSSATINSIAEKAAAASQYHDQFTWDSEVKLLLEVYSDFPAAV